MNKYWNIYHLLKNNEKRGGNQMMSWFKIDGFKNRLSYFDEDTVVIEATSRDKEHWYNIMIDKHNLPKIVEAGSSVHIMNNTGRYPYAYLIFKNGLGKRIKLDRFITNCPTDKVVDHLDFDTLNNRENNLKVCTFGDNSHRKRLTGIRGSKFTIANNKRTQKSG